MNTTPSTSAEGVGFQPSQLQEPPGSSLSLQPLAPLSSGMELDARSDTSDLEHGSTKSSADRSVGAKGASNRSAPAPFISKLFDIATRYSDVLGWGDNGESIVVHDLKALETTVLPIYFRHGNYRSFVRQLNLYEFRKDNNRKLIEYRHPEFVRSRPERLHLVERPKLGTLPQLYEPHGMSGSLLGAMAHPSPGSGGGIDTPPTMRPHPMPRAGDESKSLSGSSGDVDNGGSLSGVDADDSHYDEVGMPHSPLLHFPTSVQSSSSTRSAAAGALSADFGTAGCGGGGGGGGMPNMNMFSSAMAWMMPPGMLQSSGTASSTTGPQLPFWRPGERCECFLPDNSSSSSSSDASGTNSSGTSANSPNEASAWQLGSVEGWATEGLLVRLDAQPAPQHKPAVIPFARIHTAVRRLQSTNTAGGGGGGVKSTVGTGSSSGSSGISSVGAIRPIMPMPMAGLLGFGGPAMLQQQQAYLAAMHAQMQGQAMTSPNSLPGAAAAALSSSSSSTSASSAAAAAASAANAAVAAAANGTMVQKLCASEAARFTLTSTAATLEVEAAQLRAENADMQRRMQAMEQQLSTLLGNNSNNSYNNSRSNSCSSQGSAIAPALDPAKSFDSMSDQHAPVVTARLVSSPRASFAGRGDSYGREGSRTRSSVTPRRPSEARSEGSSVGRGKRHAERALSSEPREDDPSLQLRLANRAFTHGSSSSSFAKPPQHEPKVPNLKPLIVTPSAAEGAEQEDGLSLEAWPAGADFYPTDDDGDLIAGLDLGPLGLADDFSPDGLTPMGMLDASSSSSSGHFFSSVSATPAAATIAAAAAAAAASTRSSESGSSAEGSPPPLTTITSGSAASTATSNAAAADATQQQQTPFVRRRTMI